MGALVAIPAVASREARASDHGYGAGAYGGGPYGDPVDDGSEDTILTVETRDATNVDDSSATLAGELTQLQGYDATTVYFEWGRNGDLSNTTGARTLTSTGGFDDEVTGLDDGVEYEFRAVAESEGDVDTGGTMTFTTESGGAEAEPDAVPQIVKLYAGDTSNPKNPHADASVVWEASLADGELDSAELTVSDSAGVVHSWSYDLSGQSAERVERERIHHGGGETYAVELTVHSAHGTTGSEQTTFDAP